MMIIKRLPLLICLTLMAVLYGCDFKKSEDSKTDTDEYLDEITDESINTENETPSPAEQIEWSDGNIYSYDFTENITKIDSLGNETEIIVYKRNPPSEDNIICETKVCKWCGKEVQANDYSLEEYPNINWVRGQPDLGSIFSMFSIAFEGKKYYDLDNNRIRTEWRIDCNYPGPKGFCSLKCENEYKYR